MAKLKAVTEHELTRYVTVLDITTDNARDLARRLHSDPTEHPRTLEHGAMVLMAAKVMLELHEALLHPLLIAEAKRNDPTRQGQVPPAPQRQGLLPREPVPIRGTSDGKQT